jgi:hypothetical protein
MSTLLGYLLEGLLSIPPEFCYTLVRVPILDFPETARNFWKLFVEIKWALHFG